MFVPPSPFYLTLLWRMNMHKKEKCSLFFFFLLLLRSNIRQITVAHWVPLGSQSVHTQNRHNSFFVHLVLCHLSVLSWLIHHTHPSVVHDIEMSLLVTGEQTATDRDYGMLGEGQSPTHGCLTGLQHHLEVFEDGWWDVRGQPDWGRGFEHWELSLVC